MRSGSASAGSDDRTTKARIRDSAIDCIARYGVADTTVRRIAEAADVSPALVIHHFGSMEGLRAACDEHVAATISREKANAVSAGPQGLDLLAALRNSQTASMTGYLAEVLMDDSPVVAKLVDDLISDAEGYLASGVEAGVFTPSSSSRARAAVLSMWFLGALVLHRHVKRIFGVDPTDPGIRTNPRIAAYLAPGYEILGDGLFTPEAAARLQEAVATLAASDTTDD